MTLKETCELLDKIAEDDSVNVSFSDASLGLAVYEKICWALADKVFPEEKLNVGGAILRGDGCVYHESDSYDVSSTGEYISHEGLSYSELYDSMFVYYRSSPYWDIELERTMISDFILDECGFDKEDEDTWDLDILIREIYGDFFEDACIDVMHLKGCNPLNYFENEDMEEEDECLCIKSYLLPYYHEMVNKKQVLKEHFSLIQMVEKGIHILQELFGANFIFIMEQGLKASYFISFSGISNAMWSYPNGTLAMKREVLLAGMVIDQAIFELDRYYHFLPEEFRVEAVA